MNTPHTPEVAAAFANSLDSTEIEPLNQQESECPAATETPAESEMPYRYLFESNPQPMFIYDCETLRFLVVNDAAIRHYGYSKAEFLAMTLLDIRPQEDVPFVLESLRSTGPRVKWGIRRHKTKDGQILDVEITRHNFGFRGKTARLVLINDVTERTRMERALLQSEQEQRQLAEHLTKQQQAVEDRNRFFTLSLDLLCISDSNGYFIRLNPVFETVLGYTQEELMARPILDFVHPDDREATIARLAERDAESNKLHFENRYRCSDGSYRWLAWTSTAFQDLRYSAAHDITPVKNAEIALRRAYEELEARVVERTAQITEVNTQLLIAKNEADRANLAKSEFLSRMSHELRTPLNAILGFGQILDREALAPLQQESIQYILTGGRHLLSLINEVLDLARVEAVHIALSLEPINLAEIVAESCALVRPLAAERHISLNADAVCGDSHVQADRQRLKQVLINLLSNAIKYNCQGGEVRVYSVLRPDNRLAIAVQDTGPGISVEDQKRLFIPFERLSAGLSGVEGTGLGLAMAQRLATAMRGSLTLESLPGEGTTFFIELPLVRSPLEILADYPCDVSEPPSDQSQERCTTILTIEDNISNMRLLEMLLRSRPGTTLLTAMQGSLGLDLARQHVPDLILLDLNLPDISGREVLARLQASALTCDIPVVILSADATATQIERLLEAGARAYLTKPLDVAEFLHTLDTVLPTGETNSL